MSSILFLIKRVFHPFFIGSMIIIFFVTAIISIQVSNRTTFANTELYDDVINRWGAPITQSAPSVCYVNTGSVFKDIHKLPLSSQDIQIDTKMNYRKRGLVYFSGFDFLFSGIYTIKNSDKNDKDIVFVFPINLESNKVLLSNLEFYVNDKKHEITLSETTNKLIWTGRLKSEKTMSFKILYNGRGLDKFKYVLDPSLPVKNFNLNTKISGGTNYDYEHGVIPATNIEKTGKNDISITWNYESLESGVPVGLILPSEKSFAMIIATMIRRSATTFIFFFVGIMGIAFFNRKKLKFYEIFLISATYSFFYVLLAYLAAFLNFYVAYILSAIIISTLLFLYIKKTISNKAAKLVVLLVLSFLIVPTCAIILQGYTGLIYTFEILSGLSMVMYLSTRSDIRKAIEVFTTTPKKEAKDAII